MRRPPALLLLPAVLLIGSLVSAAPVDENHATITAVHVGIGGHYKVGVWTPVEVVLEGHREGDLVGLVVPDGEGVPSRVETIVPADVDRVRLCARFGRMRSPMAVDLRRDGRVLAERVFTPGAVKKPSTFPPAAAATRPIIAVVGPDALGLEEAIAALRRPGLSRPVITRVDGPGELPETWYGYEGVDTLILTTSQPETFADDRFSPAQRAALTRWLELGGSVILSAGSEAGDLLGEGGPLADLTPGRFERMVTLRQTGALEAYSGGSSPVPLGTAGQRIVLSVPRLADVEGTLEAREADLPLVVRTARGFGELLFLAADLTQPPLSQWGDRPKLLLKLIDLPAVRTQSAAESAAMMHYGYNDLAGQLRSALDAFAAVRLVPFAVVAALLIAYVALIGPVDYFLLRRFAPRMEWTWLTFPLIVVGFSAAAYVLAYELKGEQFRVNQVDMVDVDTATGQIRGTSWLNLFSPRMAKLGLSLQPRRIAANLQPADSQGGALFSWLGLPGTALGGMNPRTASPVLWTEPYTFGRDLTTLEGMPISIWSTRSFTGRWHGMAETVLASRLQQEAHAPAGTITNSYDFPLTDCLLAYKRWVYEIGTLEPGQTARVGIMSRRKELKTLLTGRRAVFDTQSDKLEQEMIPYDQSSRDLPYILRAMTFFTEAGGERYTGLANGYQGFTDLSGLLQSDRAILLAHGPDGQREQLGAELVRDGQSMEDAVEDHFVMYRFVLPVEPAEEP